MLGFVPLVAMEGHGSGDASMAGFVRTLADRTVAFADWRGHTPGELLAFALLASLAWLTVGGVTMMLWVRGRMPLALAAGVWLAYGVVAVGVKAAAMYWAFLDQSPGFNFAALYPYTDFALVGPILLLGLFLMRRPEGG